MTAKELRYLGREPRRKVNLVNSVIIGVGLPVWAALHSSGDGRGKAVLLATLGAYIAVLGSSNQYGLDGAAAWLDMVAGRTARTVLIGKNVAVADRRAADRGDRRHRRRRAHRRVGVPARARSASRVAGVGAGVATGNVISVRFPLRAAREPQPLRRRRRRSGLQRPVWC